ncbi:hypothetical protein HO173_000425 [Letharia columbiana]|uniref:Uncharacterized protein n=1 Tax=Letharia columbiana TaxID=112416 RepID=A0A8H6G754_9LECA|nr:uncharacterized protein HO173_000425 [Letharia columbiana]KAF6241714.1 hypothetical protein HO173_000425 [Letharia columbiana]
MRKIDRLDINLASLTEHQTQYNFDSSENPVTKEDDTIRAGRRPAVSRFEGLDHRARHNGTKGLSNHANKTIPGKSLATRRHWDEPLIAVPDLIISDVRLVKPYLGLMTPTVAAASSTQKLLLSPKTTPLIVIARAPRHSTLRLPNRLAVKVRRTLKRISPSSVRVMNSPIFVSESPRSARNSVRIRVVPL